MFVNSFRHRFYLINTSFQVSFVCSHLLRYSKSNTVAYSSSLNSETIYNTTPQKSSKLYVERERGTKIIMSSKERPLNYPTLHHPIRNNVSESSLLTSPPSITRTWAESQAIFWYTIPTSRAAQQVFLPSFSLLRTISSVLYTENGVRNNWHQKQFIFSSFY